jgi:hypothetical protein
MPTTGNRQGWHVAETGDANRPLRRENIRGTGMRMSLLKRITNDEGLSTAEYAVGTVAVAGLGGLLAKLLTSDWIFALLQKIIETAFKVIFG